ncbi:uncharacterized protein B0J16DRAFT_64598 [Fusarium flagelliforme]|uniref:Uncharacterized protein n=1 Tax=Fusarium flagelliforme TaxID=2675880 RepID=A0A395MX99_9HYPO|nr:uncharacterized protein B0J16DRAFT_64598 [Fusarium flagelliforme]KAH7192681.1 hypothetical protein B0J16DRAFT_64598 [Fusarium flagelliforme]RFN52522.1 hypothetical protein FIE12Z_3283 [Fusarium flagelliforme]
MMTPRSFLLAQRQQHQHQCPPPSPCTTGTSHHNTLSIPTPSLSPVLTPIPARLTSSPSSPSPLTSLTSSHHFPSSESQSSSVPSTSHLYRSPPASTIKLATSTTATEKSTTFSLPRWSPKYDDSQKRITVTISSTEPADAKMGKRKDWRETSSLAPSSPPKTTVSLTMRPTTPTSPVKIPTTNNRNSAHPQKRHSSQRKRSNDSRSSDNLSPSLAALLAVTDIPKHKQLQRRRRRSDKTLTVKEVIDCQHASEKELSWTFSSPLDMLLSPPQDIMDDDDSVSDCNIGCSMSTRTYSIDSIPSLDDSFSSDGLSSLGSPRTPSPCSRRTKSTPMRKSLEPVISPPGSIDEHPLARDDLDVDELDLTTIDQPEEIHAKSQFLQPFKPLRSVFKSNLTASLRALRSAARSFSALNLPSIPADDYLTRSILTIDPNVPYADERRPPVSEEMPSAAMRRYLNPTTNARIEPPTKTVFAGTFAASIQMRTYKIQRSRAPPGSTRNSYPSTSLQSQPSPAPQQQPQPQAPTLVPGMRQREMRENSDFIRIAVMEMAMRKRGKLDDQRPGRARFALPPRQTSTKPYEMGANGVPARWIPIMA